jgi:serine/threonine protein kinase
MARSETSKTRVTPHIPDHALLRPINAGSYGEVWLAKSIVGTFRAVKVVSRSRFEDDRPYEREFAGIQRFEPVSRTHPGFVAILHIGRQQSAGYFYYIMELADDLSGGQQIHAETYVPRTLSTERARCGRIPLADCLQVGLELSSALSHLHRQGLIHRDIKPSNVIFVNGRPKFADIGLVTQINQDVSFVGTPGFVAPEGPGRPTADLYSLGMLLYELAMGKSSRDFPTLPSQADDPTVPSQLWELRIGDIRQQTNCTPPWAGLPSTSWKPQERPARKPCRWVIAQNPHALGETRRRPEGHCRSASSINPTPSPMRVFSSCCNGS